MAHIHRAQGLPSPALLAAHKARSVSSGGTADTGLSAVQPAPGPQSSEEPIAFEEVNISVACLLGKSRRINS